MNGIINKGTYKTPEVVSNIGIITKAKPRFAEAILLENSVELLDNDVYATRI